MVGRSTPRTVATLKLLDSSRTSTIARRSITIPTLIAAFLFVVATAPLTVAAAAIVDIFRDLAAPPPRRLRFLSLRLLIFFAAYLTCEVAGVAIAFWIWLRHGPWNGTPRSTFLEHNFRLQCVWGSTLFGIGRRLYRLRLRVEGQEQVVPGPILLYVRHSSLADTVLAVQLVGAPFGIRLRYVLKRPLLFDPCLDIVGLRLPNRFTQKGSSRSADEIAAVADLANDLERNEGVLIYPEGTRFTHQKRNQLLERLAQRGDQEQRRRVESLRFVLPPVAGGPSALLRRNRELGSPADLVICAHAGLDESPTAADLWHGKLLDQEVAVRFWRIPAAELPSEDQDEHEWLYENWRRVDEFVAARRPARARETQSDPIPQETPGATVEPRS